MPGKHGPKWKRCVKKVRAKGKVDNEYAICTASVGMDKSLDEIYDLVKGKPAGMGETRTWSGKTYQKTAQGWIPVQGQKKPGAAQPKKPGKKEQTAAVDKKRNGLHAEIGKRTMDDKKKRDKIRGNKAPHPADKLKEMHEKLKMHREGTKRHANQMEKIRDHARNATHKHMEGSGLADHHKDAVARAAGSFASNPKEFRKYHDEMTKMKDHEGYKTTEVGGKTMMVPNPHAKMGDDGSIGSGAPKSPFHDHFHWADDKYGVGKKILTEAASKQTPVNIHTSSDLVGRDDYSSLIPKGSTVNIHKQGSYGREDGQGGSGFPSDARMDKAADRLRSQGHQVVVHESHSNQANQANKSEAEMKNDIFKSMGVTIADNSDVSLVQSNFNVRKSNVHDGQDFGHQGAPGNARDALTHGIMKGGYDPNGYDFGAKYLKNTHGEQYQAGALPQQKIDTEAEECGLHEGGEHPKTIRIKDKLNRTTMVITEPTTKSMSLEELFLEGTEIEKGYGSNYYGGRNKKKKKVRKGAMKEYAMDHPAEDANGGEMSGKVQVPPRHGESRDNAHGGHGRTTNMPQKGPGSRGGKVVGHFRSGKPKYGKGLKNVSYKSEGNDILDELAKALYMPKKKQSKKEAEKIANMHENSPGIVRSQANNEVINTNWQKQTALQQQQQWSQKKSLVKAHGPGGVLFDFGKWTGNPMADQTTRLLSQNYDPQQMQIAKSQAVAYDKSIENWVRKGEDRHLHEHGETAPGSAMNPEWAKQMNTPMDQQVAEAYKSGALDENPNQPVSGQFNKSQFQQTQMQVGNETVKATSETDQALIEMMKSGEGFVDPGGNTVECGANGGKVGVTFDMSSGQMIDNSTGELLKADAPAAPAAPTQPAQPAETLTAESI
jgi:hypothetical protein